MFPDQTLYILILSHDNFYIFFFIKTLNFRKDKCLSETIDDMTAYTLVTDDVYRRILEMDDAGIQKSKEILKKILSRDVYKCVCEKKFPGRSFSDEVRKRCVTNVNGKTINSLLISMSLI